MSGVHRLFGNNLSVVKDAALTPSSVQTSSGVFATETRRAGSGTAMLLGSFTGDDDATFELRVVSEDGAGRVTLPVFIGVGSGVLSGLAASGIANQDFTIQLADMGIDTLAAAFDMGDVSLQALATGAAGNDITASVELGELVYTETTFSTLEEMGEGVSEFKGPQWDWSTVVLNSKGEIPDTGMRLKFENDPQIYRQYKVRVGSDWLYYMSPGMVRTVPKGSKIYEVTGHRRVIVTDGVDTEQYTHVITLYDFVSQVRESSGLIEVVGIVADDKTPGGMNCQDFSFVTDAYMHPIQMKGSKYVTGLDDVELATVVNTEIVEIECVGTAEMGYEAWSVKGSVTGDLPGVRTDESYIYGPVYFKIPQMLIDYQEPVGDMGLSVNYVGREEGEAEPPICLENRVLGVRAKTGSVTFTWTQNVSLEGCECSNAFLGGAVSAECLGLEDLGGEEDLAGLDTDYKTRLIDLYEYIDEYTRDNTYFWDEVTKLGWKVLADKTVTKYSESYCAGDGTLYSSSEVTYTYQTEGEAKAKESELSAYSDCRCPFDKYLHTYENVRVEHLYNYVGGAESDLKFMHAATAVLLSALAQIYKVPAALTVWDALLAEVKVDLNNLRAAAASDTGNYVRNMHDYGNEFLERYQGAANIALLAADIVPGKTRSSSESAGCWNERPDAYYWKASGSYLPAYNNVVYHSAKQNAEGEVYSTKEFACTIVCACPQHLEVGDQVTVSFDAQGTQVNTYQLGDKFSIPIIAAGDLELSGGVDGNDTHTWKVTGDVSGEFPEYASVAEAEVAYGQNGLRFLVERGGIPFELGDQWTFSVEGGKFRWKKDSGAWSSELDIAAQALASGISVMFLEGPAPSFGKGDIFKFRVAQPHSAEHVKEPTSERWTWIGASATLTIDCGGVVPVSEIFVADHNIPSTATVLIQGSNDGFVSTDWSEAMAWNDTVLSKVLAVVDTVTHLRLSITNADSCYIGWVCAGVGMTTDLAPSLSLYRKYASISGGSSLAGGSIPQGAGWGGALIWENSISQAEMAELLVLLDYLKVNDSEPVLLLPHILSEAEGKLCRIDADSVEITDVFNFQPDDVSKRIQSVTVPLDPVFL